MAPIPVILLGLGSIGLTIGKAVADERQLEAIAGVDIDPKVLGRRLAEVCDADLPEIVVVDSLAATHAPAGAVVLQATGSRLEAIKDQLVAAITCGYHVVSTCEELVWPWDDHPALAGEINRLAREHEVTVLGVGVNPGFVMDTLPVLLSRAAGDLEAVHVKRIVDLTTRRLPLQRKMGVGMEPARVREQLDHEQIGHVGLSNSVQMLAAGLGWHMDVIDVDSRPIVARESTETGLGAIPPGKVIGIRQRATGMARGLPRLILELVMEAQAEGGTHDEILIDGAQSLRLRLDGLQGDTATAILMVNQALRICDFPPGLQTMLSVPLLPEKANVER